jgi:hypothetical protein
MIQIPSAIILTVLTAIVILFQLCLTIGMPWGSASMGGKIPGKYPPKMRIVAIVNILILIVLAIIVLSRAGLVFPQLLSGSATGIWFVVAFSGIGTIMNTITPSKIERIWAPVAAIQLITSLIVASS